MNLTSHGRHGLRGLLRLLCLWWLLAAALPASLTVPGPAQAAAPAPGARAASAAASAPLPAVNLQVQVRMVDAATADAGDDSAAENLRRRHQGYTVGTQPAAGNAPWLQQALVLNGQWASLQMAQSVPFQWVRAAGQPPAPSTAAGPTKAGSNGGAVVNELAWLPSGTAWAVRPEWAAGAAAARVDIEVRAASLQPGLGNAPLPGVNTSQTRSTVMAPLDTWVTVARTGSRPTTASGQTWSTDQAAANAARVLQVRISQP